MSGPLTVPFTIGAFFVPAWYRVIFACLAICAAIVTCYRVWATEYERAEVEIGRNQKPEIHVRLLDALILSPRRDTHNRGPILGLPTNRIALYINVENHRPVATSLEDASLKMRVGEEEYQSEKAVDGKGTVITDVGETKELFSLDVIGLEPLEYAHHDHGWIVFELIRHMIVQPVLEAELEVTVVDGLGNTHSSGSQRLMLRPAVLSSALAA